MKCDVPYWSEDNKHEIDPLPNYPVIRNPHGNFPQMDIITYSGRCKYCNEVLLVVRTIAKGVEISPLNSLELCT